MNTLRYGLSNFLLTLIACGLAHVNTAAADDLPEAGFRSMLVDQVTSQFKNSVSEDQPGRTYDSLGDFKAGAACLRWGGTVREPYFMYSYWYYWDYKSPEAAAKAALDRCEQERNESERATRSKCNCELVLEGSEKKVSPPRKPIPELISDLDKQEPRPKMLCSAWIKDNKISIPPFGKDLTCPGYYDNEVLRYDFLLERLDDIANTDAPEIYPSAPSLRGPREYRGKDRAPQLYSASELRFSPPTNIPVKYATPYTLPEGWGYEYKLHQIPTQFSAQFLDRLNTINESKLFGRFPARQLLDDRTGAISPELYFAKYVRSYDLEANADVLRDLNTRGAAFPEYTAAVAQGEHSVRLWVVATIPIEKNWIPLGAPLRTVEPLALQTNKALYIFSTDVTSFFRYRGSAGGNALSEYQSAFDVSGCSDQKGCVEKTMSTFKNELIRKFGEPPTSANLSKLPSPPNQFRLQRLYEKSNVLDGFRGPWYEITTYTISMWGGSQWDGVRQEVADTEQKPDATKIFVYVDLGLQIGIGQQGKYPEPSADQYQMYNKVVGNKVQEAVNSTTALLGGTVIGGVGIIAKTNSSESNK